jgi:hypothetical protein
MNIAHTFPELNEGQRRMLERYIEEREQAAVSEYRQNSGQPIDKKA